MVFFIEWIRVSEMTPALMSGIAGLRMMGEKKKAERWEKWGVVGGGELFLCCRFFRLDDFAGTTVWADAFRIEIHPQNQSRPASRKSLVMACVFCEPGCGLKRSLSTEVCPGYAHWEPVLRVRWVAARVLDLYAGF